MTLLDRLLELAGKATPGPWRWDGSRMAGAPNRKKRLYDPTVFCACDGVVYSEYTSDSATIDIKYDDACYIAACSPEVVTALVRVAKAAEKFTEFRHPDDNTPYKFYRRLADALTALQALDTGSER